MMSEKTLQIQGSKYVAAVMQVMETDPDGKPRTLRLVYPDEKVSVENEPEFIVGFVKAKVLEPLPSKSH
jgi:hypothetical protein